MEIFKNVCVIVCEYGHMFYSSDLGVAFGITVMNNLCISWQTCTHRVFVCYVIMVQFHQLGARLELQKDRPFLGTLKVFNM